MVGLPLFERVRQRLKLTGADEILVYHARASASELNQACSIINDLTGLRRGKIGVSAVESVTRGLLLRILAEFWQRLPNVAAEVRTVGSRGALRLAAEGETELGIAFGTRVPKGTQRLAGASLSLGALLWPTTPPRDASISPGSRRVPVSSMPTRCATSTLSRPTAKRGLSRSCPISWSRKSNQVCGVASGENIVTAVRTNTSWCAMSRPPKGSSSWGRANTIELVQVNVPASQSQCLLAREASRFVRIH